MKTFPSSLLRNWPDLWRYPDLMQCVATGTEDIEPSGAVLSIAQGIATQRSPEDVLRSLLESKNFRAVHFMLDMPHLKNEIGDGYAKLKADALDFIKSIHFELVARLFELEARESRLGLKAVSSGDHIRDIIEADAANADRLLTTWSRELEELQQDRRKDLEHRLGDIAGQPLAGMSREWTDTIRRFISTNRFEMAERLLATGPGSSPSFGDPESIPRSQRWHYNFPVASAIRKIRGSEPPPDVGFQERWNPQKDDLAARHLLDWLEQRLSSSSSLTAEDVSSFACILDEFLSDKPSCSRDVREIEGGFFTSVYEVTEARILRLSAGSKGIPLWVPVSADVMPPQDLSGEQVLLAFHPERAPVGRASAIGFDARIFFPLLPTPRYRRVNFLRSLMRRMAIKDAIPAEFDPSTIHLEPGDSPWSYAAWFLDYLGLQVDSPATIDLICFYATRNDILVLLLSTLVTSIGERSAIISSSDVHRLWLSQSFRDSVLKRLIGPLESEPETRAVLGCIFFLAASGEELRGPDLQIWLSEAFDFKDERAVSAALQWLTSANLIELHEDGSIRLPQSGITHLVRSAIGDPETFVHSALET